MIRIRFSAMLRNWKNRSFSKKYYVWQGGERETGKRKANKEKKKEKEKKKSKRKGNMRRQYWNIAIVGWCDVWCACLCAYIIQSKRINELSNFAWVWNICAKLMQSVNRIISDIIEFSLSQSIKKLGIRIPCMCVYVCVGVWTVGIPSDVMWCDCEL